MSEENEILEEATKKESVIKFELRLPLSIDAGLKAFMKKHESKLSRNTLIVTILDRKLKELGFK